MEIGKYNTLHIIRKVDFGVYLSDGNEGEVLMPQKYVSKDAQIGDAVEVFVYTDSEDRLVATTEKPFAQVGMFAYLRAVGVSQHGAFLDWGLVKDLFVPFSEQNMKMREGAGYVVYILLDEKTNRIIASAKIDRYVDTSFPEYEFGEEVDLLIWQKTDLGFKAIINHRHVGTIYENEVFARLYVGEETKGYIKKVREDGKIDLYLHKPGHTKLKDNSDIVFEKLQDHGGFIATTDKSPAEEIYNIYGLSKKNYKKAVGDLYKSRKIAIEDNGIRVIAG
ncbi:MAG TPA: S1-like domain-containing RNA-binding protein [Cytophagales bacterium]|nr:S1-like domain-containing RNA-binding protein [Cytophagales bacterium]